MAKSLTIERRGYIDPSRPFVLRALMAVYRFLASVKLAVISISSLAATLCYATWFEKAHGGPATQEYVYQGVGFSILLAFLAINIFCAASIRYPWKRRQAGFVVTHIGLLTLIFGSWWGFKYSDEGRAGAPEGGVIDKLIRDQDTLVRIKSLDRQGQPEGEYELPFKGGPFNWPEGRWHWWQSLLVRIGFDSKTSDWPEGRYEVISNPKQPFKVAVKEYYTAAMPRHVHIAGVDGTPMLRLRPMIKAPGKTTMSDVFETGEERWFVIPARTMGYRVSRKAGPATFAFLYVDKPELVEDFLNPPKNPGTLGVARLRYVDKSNKPRTYEVRLDDTKPETPFTLPDSDLTVTLVAVEQKATDRDEFIQALGDTELRVVKFDVQKANGPKITHAGFAAQPMIPAVLASEEGQKADKPLLSIGYYRPPTLGGAGMAGNFGVVEVMGDSENRLYYRVFGRDETPTPPGETKTPKTGVLKGTPGPLRLDDSITAFGGNPNMPMTLTFSADQYLTSGEEKTIYEPYELPIGQRGNGLAAALLEMTVDGETKEFWVHRPPGLNTKFEPVRFKSKAFEMAFDCDRKPLPFSLKLIDFDVDFEPGTQQATKFVSQVEMTDQEVGIKNKPITISMNQPLTHRKLTFYQSSYERLRDANGRETGDFQSVFQVGYDAGRFLKYLGCALVVLGAFLQFYMKSGLFTDGGKRDDQKAADRARRLLERKGKPQPLTTTKPVKTKKRKNQHDDTIL